MAIYRDVELGVLTPEVREDGNGVLLITIREKLPPAPARMTDRLIHWAARAPDRVFLAERASSGEWRAVTYREAEEMSARIASALLARGLSAERPIAILSGNDVDHGLLALAAMRAGIPFAPISPAYALMSSDHGKLRGVLNRLTPGMVFVAKAKPFERAVAATCATDVEIVAAEGTMADRPVTPFADLLSAQRSPSLATAEAAVNHDTIVKILFTSGSTGEPKGVINTQRMMLANQGMLTHLLPFSLMEPPVLVDWLPWNHTFGGNHNFCYVLNHGGSLYIDGGKPTPAGIAETVRNLREIAPTIYFNVPKGFEELSLKLREDKALAENFFSRLRLNFYAGAVLPAHVAKAMEEAGEATIGQRVYMLTGLGATETAPSALNSTKETAKPGRVGLPLPGVELKLLPNGGKLEMRVKGPNITPGYWRDPVQTAKILDEAGFYIMGDALRFAVPGDVKEGFIFDGRVAEDFKLVTGTWVSVGPLRLRLVSALAPLAKDAVIAGHDRGEVTALIFPDLDVCKEIAGGGTDAEALASLAVRERFREALAAMAKDGDGSSTRVSRILLMAELPSIDAGEITDKGSLNQRAVLSRRASEVEALYQSPVSPRAISAV